MAAVEHLAFWVESYYIVVLGYSDDNVPSVDWYLDHVHNWTFN